ncbi:MAG: hypothetical protein JSR15_11960, partial [Proteobacteria bacterium]|nr:hypothetical protein [Pseudomonadota bacterium]
MPTTDTTVQATQFSGRVPGWLLIVSGIAMIVLLAMHPNGNARDFAAVLQEEAANRGVDAIVHGGLIVVMAIQMACYAVFSLRYGPPANASIAGLVLFCLGATLLAGSALIDGLVLPAIAARYAAIPARLEAARTLYVFGATMISFLMPLGIGFQSLGILAWSWHGLRIKGRALRVVGLLIGLVALVAAATVLSGMNPMTLMLGI